MNLKVEKQPKNTYKILITISKDEVNEAFEHALEHEAKDFETKGFRKGKAPKKVVKEKIDPTKLRSHALNHLLTDAYTRAVKEHKLMPIVSPQFDLEVFEEGKEGKVTMIIVEKPEIKLGDYKKALKDLGAKKEKEKKGDEPVVISHQEVVDAIIKTGTIEVADSLVEEEVNRMMSSLIDQTAKLGITMEQYLESIKKKPAELRAEYTKSATSTLMADFLITEIAKNEKITVTDEEVEKTISSIPDEKSRAALSNPDQKLYVKAVLMKNKTLQTLTELATPEKSKKTKKENVKSDKDKKKGENKNDKDSAKKGSK